MGFQDTRDIKTASNLSAFVHRFVIEDPSGRLMVNTAPGTVSLGVLDEVFTVAGVQFGRVIINRVAQVVAGGPIAINTLLTNDALGRAVPAVGPQVVNAFSIDRDKGGLVLSSIVSDSQNSSSIIATADVLIYIDGLNGNDANPGTAAKPIKTIGRFLGADGGEPMTPPFWSRKCRLINVSQEPLPWPIDIDGNPVPFRVGVPVGPFAENFVFVGIESTVATLTAAAGSGGNVINTAGPIVPDAYYGKTVFVLTGPSAGQEASIKFNDAGQILVTPAFGPIDPGDLFAVQQAGSTIDCTPAGLQALSIGSSILNFLSVKFLAAPFQQVVFSAIQVGLSHCEFQGDGAAFIFRQQCRWFSSLIGFYADLTNFLDGTVLYAHSEDPLGGSITTSHYSQATAGVIAKMFAVLGFTGSQQEIAPFSGRKSPFVQDIAFGTVGGGPGDPCEWSDIDPFDAYFFEGGFFFPQACVGTSDKAHVNTQFGNFERNKVNCISASDHSSIDCFEVTSPPALDPNANILAGIHCDNDGHVIVGGGAPPGTVVGNAAEVDLEGTVFTYAAISGTVKKSVFDDKLNVVSINP